MLQSFLNALFSCSHRRTSFPLTPTRKSGVFAAQDLCDGTYVVCLDCGKKFAYNWNEMRIGKPVETPAAQPEAQPSFR